MKKKIVQEETQDIVEELDKNVISSQEVDIAVHGDENALAEQMERVKQLSKEQQLEEIEHAKRKAEENKILEQKKQEEQQLLLKKQQEELAINQKQQQEAQLAAKAQEEQRMALERQKQEEIARIEAKKQNQIQVQSAPQEKKSNPKEKGGPSTFKTILAIILFGAFFAMVYFLPEITNMVNEYKESRQPKPIITDGISTCTLSKSTENFDVDLTATFSIINSKVYKMTFTTVTKGDKVTDKEELLTAEEYEAFVASEA